MNYALIHNNQIEVGPRSWLWSEFKEYLDDNGLDSSSVPRKAPDAPIITDDWKIVPVYLDPEPAYARTYEQLAGPFLTINEDNVTGTWSIAPVDLEISKAQLKEKVTDNRYKVETGGIKVTIQGTEVSLDTSRDGRQIYLDTYIAMGTNETINWKFTEAWIAVTKTDMQTIVLAGKDHIQSCFNWEKDKHTVIDACTTRAELEAVELRHPMQVT